MQATKKDFTIALVGNPNVGKSTVFNSLTGLKQHTGNWPGKTVSYAEGYYTYKETFNQLIDLPGIYSLATHSREEEVTRDFICFEKYNAVIVVCDATCLERNLNLVLQILSLTPHVILCINLIDEARRKKITVDCNKLSMLLHIPVVSICAKNKNGLNELLSATHTLITQPNSSLVHNHYYPLVVSQICDSMVNYIDTHIKTTISSLYISLKFLEEDHLFLSILQDDDPLLSLNNDALKEAYFESKKKLSLAQLNFSTLQDLIVTSFIKEAEKISNQVVTTKKSLAMERDRKIDRIFIGKYTRYPVMFLLLLFILWLTIVGANYPSDFLFDIFSHLEILLTQFLVNIHTPTLIIDMLMSGVYRILTWVISVMLPPMAIFFPLFTLLEDLGYLPRMAFNLDHCFKKCHACGKQALTMCMGLGCNAVGVEGCRIIDSPRERLIALLTNSLVPCNGRFPTLILIINIFFVSKYLFFSSSLLATLFLALAIIFSILLTFFASYLLSKTVLKGLPSSFTLELPPYRKPQIIQTLIRSLLDRTLYVLKRAIYVAAPSGLIIWLLATITIGENPLIYEIASFLDPFAHFFGLSGVILLAFILGLSANEIILPIMLMIYMASTTLDPLLQTTDIKNILLSNGWTPLTALCTFIFLLIHWPCSTTLITIYKETKSFKWTSIAFLLPTCLGLSICFIINTLGQLFGL